MSVQAHYLLRQLLIFCLFKTNFAIFDPHLLIQFDLSTAPHLEFSKDSSINIYLLCIFIATFLSYFFFSITHKFPSYLVFFKFAILQALAKVTKLWMEAAKYFENHLSCTQNYWQLRYFSYFVHALWRFHLVLILFK